MIVGPRGTRVVLTLKRKQSQVRYKTELIRGDALLFLEIDNKSGLSKLNVMLKRSQMRET
eukprot:753784-Hanusia_phi.AAC.4